MFLSCLYASLLFVSLLILFLCCFSSMVGMLDTSGISFISQPQILSPIQAPYKSHCPLLAMWFRRVGSAILYNR